MRIPSQAHAQKAMTRRVAIELPHTNRDRLGETIGFMLGDGHICRKKGEVSFVNADKYCVSRMLENFEQTYGIVRDRFFYYLTVPFKADGKTIEHVWIRTLSLKDRKSVV